MTVVTTNEPQPSVVVTDPASTGAPVVSAASPTPEPTANADGSTKAERTRLLLIATALDLFKTQGYDGTTMRAIATAAGVSVGNAYYHFESKEHLIQAFYDQAQVDHINAVQPVLDRTADLETRIIGVIHAWIDVMSPYRAFAGSFFKNAADPTSALSPFSPESAPARNASIDMWRSVIDTSDTKVAKALRAELPELAWLFFMGVVLFWVHDRSHDNMASKLLVARLAPTIVRVIGLAKLPVLRATVADLVALTAELKMLAGAMTTAPADTSAKTPRR
jgi:AcrR family transcriptional regulator